MAITEQILDLLQVQLDAFAVLEIENGCGLRFPAGDIVVVHFVLKGEGSLACEHGTFELRPGMMVVVPKRLPKQINATGELRQVVDLEAKCPSSDEILRVGAGETADLLIACGVVFVGFAETIDVLGHLERPLFVEHAGIKFLFGAICEEVSVPSFGTKVVVEAAMKQIMILLLRSHFKRPELAAPLSAALHPQLARAVAEVMTRPADSHTVEKLAGLAAMSRSKFNRQFAAHYGCTPMEFVQTVRLRAAARMLVSSILPVKSIASAVGYRSRSQFSRAFTARYGMDPTRYRTDPAMSAEGNARHPEAT